MQARRSNGRLCRPCVDCGTATGRFCDGVPLPGGGFKDCIARERCPGERETRAENSALLQARRALRGARSVALRLQDHRPARCAFCRGQAWCCPRSREHRCECRCRCLKRLVSCEHLEVNHPSGATSGATLQAGATIHASVGSSVFTVGFTSSLFLCSCVASRLSMSIACIHARLLVCINLCFATTRFDTSRAAGGESPAHSRFASTIALRIDVGTTMDTVPGLKHRWRQALPLSLAEGGTVTTLTARRLWDAKAQLQTGGKLTGSHKSMN